MHLSRFATKPTVLSFQRMRVRSTGSGNNVDFFLSLFHYVLRNTNANRSGLKMQTFEVEEEFPCIKQYNFFGLGLVNEKVCGIAVRVSH